MDVPSFVLTPITPAIQAGLTNHVWGMEEIVRLREEVEAPVSVAQAN